MYKANTVFILGAGASKEAGLPVGLELADLISKRLKQGISGLSVSAQNYLLSFGSRTGRYEKLYQAAQQIAREVIGHNSIDQYVDARQNDDVSLVAKLAIADEIKAAESKSNLFQRTSGDTKISEQVAKSAWYDIFFKAAHQGYRAENLSEMFEPVAVINFNYDRTLEQFLEIRMSQYFRSMSKETNAIVGTLKILRPYGSLGPLRNTNTLNPYTQFHDDVFVSIGDDLPAGIRTFNELADSAVQTEITNLMNAASTVVFLGYGFHPQNMKIIQRTNRALTSPRIFATAYNASKHDLSAYRQSLESGLGTVQDPRSVVIENEKSGKFLADIARSLVR